MPGADASGADASGSIIRSRPLTGHGYHAGKPGGGGRHAVVVTYGRLLTTTVTARCPDTQGPGVGRVRFCSGHRWGELAAFGGRRDMEVAQGWIAARHGSSAGWGQG